MRRLRIFYRESGNQIVWHHEAKSPEGIDAIFPTTFDEDLAELPDKKPDGVNPLGGSPRDYSCDLLSSAEDIEAYDASDENSIVDGKVVIGKPRPEPPPEPITDWVVEYSAATTTDGKLDVIARRLGLK